MKRILALLLALVLALGMTACGEDTKQPQTSTTTKKTVISTTATDAIGTTDSVPTTITTAPTVSTTGADITENATDATEESTTTTEDTTATTESATTTTEAATTTTESAATTTEAATTTTESAATTTTTTTKATTKATTTTTKKPVGSVTTTTEKPTTITTTTKKTTTATTKATTTQKPTTKPTTKATRPTITTRTTPSTTKPVMPESKAFLNGVSLTEYTIVYAEEALDYTDRAARYLRDEIRVRTGVELPMATDDDTPTKHEIVVGETNRAISKSLDANTEGLEFSMLAKNGHVAMEGDYFIIAAAAYYFVTTYITGETMSATVPEKVEIHTPIVEKANNYIFLIGDGMGINQTKLPEEYDLDRFEREEVDANNFTDGENFFYGYLFPNQGTVRTQSVYGGITDSAASATALATGYKTKNGYVGKDKNDNDLKSLTEMAAEMGKNTAIMSTEGQTGATPGGFSAHVVARDMYDDIKADQVAMTEKYGTIINCKYDYYTSMGIRFYLEKAVTETLDQLNQGDKGFFMMYEEAYIDKHSHNQDKEKATWAVFRFNQAIGLFMEFAFYNPDTMVIITADHETGNLTDLGGYLKYSNGDHSAKLVPVFAYGVGTEVFHDKEIENVQIPKTIAKMWGQQLAADTDEQYPPLN